MSGLEIERKFLVRNSDYKRQAYSSSRIQQGYICSGHGRTVRVRIRDDRGYLTIKGPSDKEGVVRYEFEKEITLDEARELMKLCVVAEVELQAADEPYEKPDFIGEEVTGDHRYSNAHLSKHPFTTWS